ncbi:hypothetical protein R2R35_15540 [Anaerocolumna sp. AGMB13020]|uniref:hypothetical protein n=1 Tax=Anaerocolumna sp. AGMB13020 TaxID=3081750 RepID=UPI002955ABAA|nr:hypothetical protein [Anaerocolumna sp. AGMB13020]WOO35208.1 hypothetical protein R2R35_15540 [Anaerocolumna sp. AGMB13020]
MPDEVVNFGCFEEEKEIYSYVEISVEIGLLLTSKAVDFIVTGYPIQDAQRKMEDTKLLKSINSLSRISMVDILNGLDEKFCSKIIEKQNVVDYILNYGVEEDIVQWLKNKR